jgi:preprotein translocase subunit YajC
MGDGWPLLSGSVLFLVISWVVLISFFSRMIRRWRIHRWFTRRFHRPQLPITVGDTVVTTFGFNGEVVSVSEQFAELRIRSGDRKAVIRVYRGEILDRAPAPS